MLIVLCSNVKAHSEYNVFWVHLTDREGMLHYQDPYVAKEVKNDFTHEGDYKIKFHSFPYSTNHSLEFFYMIFYPEINEMHLIVQAKPGNHLEPWKIIIKNGGEEISTIAHEGYVYLKVPIHFGFNKLTVSAELGVPVDTTFKVELFDFVTIDLERNHEDN